MRRAVVAALLGAVATFSFFPASSADAQSSIEGRTRTIARVLASGGIGGRFGEPVCRHGLTIEPSPGALYTYALMREARSPDRPMVLDTGGLLAPHGVARYAADEDPGALAELVEALGYRALALGVQELSAPRASLLDVVRLLRRRGIPTIASNLRCEDEAIPFCDLLVDASDGPSLHRVGDRTAAVLSFLPEGATQQIAPDLAGGIEIEAIADAMPDAVREARDAGAELVIAIAAMSSSAALELAQRLPEDGRPDLLLLAGASDLLFARPATVVPAIAAPPQGDAV
ncbi:MAG: hypothetical protein M3Y87_09985, partial [Myxococcota bacterium]|nr:hypothetical protein [Myxococcota bacterium]